jgi:predicted tellurium resistance membrane protein TerC
MDSWILQISKIFWIESLLSGEGVLIIALAFYGLPSWKERFLGVSIGAVIATFVHLIAAVGFSLAPFFSSPLIYVQLLADVLLVWIAIRLLVRAADTLPKALLIAVIGSFLLQIASIDNLVAIAAVAQDRAALALGIVATIPLWIAVSMFILASLVSGRFAIWAMGSILLFILIATALSLIMGEFVFSWVQAIPIVALAAALAIQISGFPILRWACAAFLGSIAGEMMLEEPFIGHQLSQWGTSAWMTQTACALVVVLFGWICGRRPSAPK